MKGKKSMTMTEALKTFDVVDQTDSGPVARCCVIPVIMDSQDGVKKIYCAVCGRTVTNVWRESWVITEWGDKGISFRGLGLVGG